MQYKRDPEQGRHVAGAEHLGDEAGDQRRDAEPQHPHCRGENERRGGGRRHHEIRREDAGAQDVEQPQQDVLGVARAKPARRQRADAVHAADDRQGLGAQHRVLAADREIGRQMRRQKDEVEAAHKIGARHDEKRPVPHRLAEHLAHRGAPRAAPRHVIGAAGPEPGRQHDQCQHQEEQHADLPRLMRQQPLRRERHQEGAERPRGRDDPQRLAAPLFRHRARRRGHRQ